MLIIHILFVLSSFISFIGRVILSELKPEMLNTKLLKIAPHIIDTFLLLSGISLVIRGEWLENGDYGWIISKFIILLIYIGLARFVMRTTGTKRWVAFIAAIACYGYILSIAISKEGFF
jgi:uncharacterized membrane protein SirB2